MKTITKFFVVATILIFGSMFSLSAGAQSEPCPGVTAHDIRYDTEPAVIQNYLANGTVVGNTYCVRFNFVSTAAADPDDCRREINETIRFKADALFRSSSAQTIYIDGLNLTNQCDFTGILFIINNENTGGKKVILANANFSNIVGEGLRITGRGETVVKNSTVTCSREVEDNTGIVINSKATIQGNEISDCTTGVKIDSLAGQVLLGGTSEDADDNLFNTFISNTPRHIISILWANGASSTARFAYNHIYNDSFLPDIEIAPVVMERLNIQTPEILRAEGAEIEPIPNALNCMRNEITNRITARWINVRNMGNADALAIHSYIVPPGSDPRRIPPHPQNFLTWCEPTPEGRCPIEIEGLSETQCGPENSIYAVAMAYNSNFTSAVSSTFKLKDRITSVGPITGGVDIPTPIAGSRDPVEFAGDGIGAEFETGPVDTTGGSTIEGTPSEPEYTGGGIDPKELTETTGMVIEGKQNNPDPTATVAAMGKGCGGTIAPSANDRISSIATLLWWLALPIPVRALARRRMRKR